MNYTDLIHKFEPTDVREAEVKQQVLDCIKQFGDAVLTRECRYHLTPSAFIVNWERNRTLFIHHKRSGIWQWTGGHADGNPDLRSVALAEAEEETGLQNLQFLSSEIASLDIWTIPTHVRRGEEVQPHFHIGVGFILQANDADGLVLNEEETKGIRWFAFEEIADLNMSEDDRYLYEKLIYRTRRGF